MLNQKWIISGFVFLLILILGVALREQKTGIYMLKYYDTEFHGTDENGKQKLIKYRHYTIGNKKKEKLFDITNELN